MRNTGPGPSSALRGVAEARFVLEEYDHLVDEFGLGVVEQTLLPHLGGVDVFATVSQGRV